MLFAKNHIYMKLLEFAVVVREGDRGRKVKRGVGKEIEHREWLVMMHYITCN